MSFNGWTNYETWDIKLWLDNEQGTYTEVTSEASHIVADAKETEVDPDAFAFAAWLESYTEELYYPEDISGPCADLLRSAWQGVNWHEIAESYLDDAREESN